MEDHMPNIENKKVFGMLFLLGMITDVVCEILQIRLYSSNISKIDVWFWIFNYGAKICAAICLLKPNQHPSCSLLSASMIAAIFATIVLFIAYKTVVFSGMINIIAYAAISALIGLKSKNIKLITAIIILDIFFAVIFSKIFSVIQLYVIRYASSVFFGGSIYIFSVSELFCIMLFLWSVLPTANRSSAEKTLDTR